MTLKHSIANYTRQPLNTMWSRFKRARDGIATIEFALVALVFFPLLIGTVETGLVLYATSVIEGAANTAIREGKIESAFTKASEDERVADARETYEALFRDLGGGLLQEGHIQHSLVQNENAREFRVDNQGFSSDMFVYRVSYEWDIFTPYAAAFLGDTYLIEVSVPMVLEPGTLDAG